MFFWILFFIAFLPLTLIVPVRKIGKSNLKELKGKNYIIACNHMSNWDAVMLDLKLSKKIRYLAKKELFKNKLIAPILSSFGAISIDRANPEPKAIKKTLRLISNKKTVCIFPQGTRKKSPEISGDSAKEGVAMFAIRTNTPVVPMMFSKKIKLFRRTKLYIGKPVYPDETRKRDKAYYSEFSNLIIEKMNELIEGDKQ